MTIKVDDKIIYKGPIWKLIFYFCLWSFLAGFVNRAIELIFE